MADMLIETPAWQALARHHAAVVDLHLRDLFARTAPASSGSRSRRRDRADLSKHRVTAETVALLLALADRAPRDGAA
jgi:glucose-6-phosphate isomerase